MYPSGGAGAQPGQYLKPAMQLSVSARSKEAKAAVQVIDFLMNDKDANLVLGVERGVPASSAIRAAVEPTLDELGKSMAQYIAFISDKVGPLPAPPPSGAGEIPSVLRRVNEQIGFGRQTPAEGARQFVTEARAILVRG
jgi:multiple sugar transport system substrate-binding protein